MKTKMICGLIVLLIIIGFFFIFNKKEKVATSTETEVKTEGSMGGERYTTYSPEKVVEATGKILLFFHAPWCPYCRSLDKELNKEISTIPENLLLLKTDYDTETALKQKYGVTYQHTFVQIDNKGNLITKWNGSENLSQILSNIK